jgi:hypothetical protein
MIGRRPNPERYFASKCAPCFLRKANHSNHRIGAHTGANHTVPYGTVLLGGSSRHFVPGYDQTVPPGLGQSPSGQSFLQYPNSRDGLSDGYGQNARTT